MVKNKNTKVKAKKTTVKTNIVFAKSPMVNFPLGDFLIKLKNAALSGKDFVESRDTKLISAVCEVLKKEGYLTQIDKNEGKIKVVFAKAFKSPVLLDVKLVSKPGLRIYLKHDDVTRKTGPEIYILSTPAGVMSSKQAVKTGVGGELIAKIWWKRGCYKLWVRLENYQ